MTPLDRAHAAMEAAPDDDTRRLTFYDRLADAELFLLLKAEPVGDMADPETFDPGNGPVVLAFDLEDRLTAFTGRAAPYAALSGRALATLLAGEGLGLGLNFGAPSEILIPADGVEWLAATLAERPAELDARIEAVHPPGGVPEAVLTALDAKLGLAGGRADHAWLVEAEVAGVGRGHLLGIVDAVPGAEGALTQAVAEALVFSGLEAGWLDVAFFRSDDPAVARMARVGLRIDLPEPDVPEAPAAPGSDPSRPPKLR